MSKARDLANAGTALTSVSATELGYVDGVTSAIQTQVDAKTAKATLTTKSDIYAASAASTPTRLAEAEAKATARQAVLAQLGITEEQAKLLLS